MNFFSEIMSTEIEEDNCNPKLSPLSKSILAGQQILEQSTKKENLEQHDIVIISLYRKVLEQADGLFILLDHDSNSAATSTFRTMYETSIGMQFIFEDPAQIENRANAYHVAYIYEQLNWAQKAIRSGELSSLYTIDELKEKVVKFERTLSKKPLNLVNKIWLREKAKLNKRNKYLSPKWYSLFDGEDSFTKLASRFKGTHPVLYSGYSLESHGYTALQNVKYDEVTRKQFLSPLRYRHTGYNTLCFLSRTLLSMCSSFIIKRYCPEIRNEFEDFFIVNR